MKIVISWLVMSLYVYLPTLVHSSINVTRCFDSERDALLQFKHGIAVDHCGLLTSWGRDADCCKWQGVDCSNRTGHVIALRLQGLPDDSSLDSCLEGTIPDAIASFDFLRELHLQRNRLTGEITQSIGQLSMLEILDVSSNALEGTLTETHFSTLSRLRVLRLSDNSGLMMKMGSSWDPPFQLDTIDLRSCRLGPLFPKWLQTQTDISYLDVSDAQILDSVPVTFWNSFSSNLQYLNMSNNRFHGMLPNLPEKIEMIFALDMSSNLFEGVIPSRFTEVQFLYLNNNKFSDSSVLCPQDSSFLVVLDLSNNLFSGELPDCWMNFHSLWILHLENNGFSGNIPKSLGSLNELFYLLLNNNSFSGPLPISFQNFRALQILNLENNLLTGHIPPWIGVGNAFPDVSFLILGRNNFTGEIPTSICKLANLEILDLAFNYISGSIPHCIGNFTGMRDNLPRGINFTNAVMVTNYPTIFHFSNDIVIPWKREDQIFKEVVYAKYIDLSGNKLNGEIPNGISRLIGLISLDLSNNRLDGCIPSDIGNLSNLELLDLSDNHLTGGIPVSLAQLNFLGTLNLSNNYLSGKIPTSTQLQGFDTSSYMGNLGLCDAPLPRCGTDQVPSNAGSVVDSATDHDEDGDNGFFLGLYISVVLGFIFGFWGFCGTLIIKTSWRHAYFRKMNDIRDRVYVITMLTIAKAWRKADD